MQLHRFGEEKREGNLCFSYMHKAHAVDPVIFWRTPARWSLPGSSNRPPVFATNGIFHFALAFISSVNMAALRWTIGVVMLSIRWRFSEGVNMKLMSTSYFKRIFWVFKLRLCRWVWYYSEKIIFGEGIGNELVLNDTSRMRKTLSKQVFCKLTELYLFTVAIR